MTLRFHKHFLKALKKQTQMERELVKEKLELFLLDPFHPRLRNHPLKGKYHGYRSIDIRPDIRAIYKDISDQEVIFVVLGSHAELYDS